MRSATAHSLLLLGERAWRVEVSLFRWRAAASLAQIIYLFRQHVYSMRKRNDGILTVITVEPYLPGRNVISLGTYRGDHTVK